MKDDRQVRRWDLVWGLPASLVLHALLAAVLIYGLPMPAPQMEEQQAVSVTFVPPPDEPKPKPPPKQPEAEKPPVPKVEKPPEPKLEKPPEPKAEKPPPPAVPTPAMQQPKPSPIEVLKPVYEFGDKDAGPRKSLDGSSARDNSPAPSKDEDPKPPMPATSAEDKSAASPGSEQQPDAADDGEKQAAPDKPATPDQEAAMQPTEEQGLVSDDADKQAGTEPAPLAGDAEVALPAMAEVPQPRPAAAQRRVKFSKPGGGSTNARNSTGLPAAKSERYSELPGVRVLRSDIATGDAGATTSMAGVPRDQRVAKLCASELQQKLVSASYFPNLVPLVSLKIGNVLDVPDAAFRTRSTWYNLTFRCEVDDDATRVISFGLDVGSVIPPEEWGRLGLPSY